MYRFNILSAGKLLQMPLVNNNINQARTNLIKLMTPACTPIIVSKKGIQSQKKVIVSRNTTRPGFAGHLERILSKSNFFNPMRYRLALLAYNLYEDAVDTIDYQKFYKEFKMPDTFVSWFVITEIHVWMLMVRCMAEGNDGLFTRTQIVNAMWEDVNVRGKQLTTKDSKVSYRFFKKQVVELSAQFNACIIAYDEGITGDDKILASAVWRRIFQSECNDPEKVEKLVHYLRKQTFLLEQIAWKDIVGKRSVGWQGLDLVNSN